jgi:hypothetical protein
MRVSGDTVLRAREAHVPQQQREQRVAEAFEHERNKIAQEAHRRRDCCRPWRSGGHTTRTHLRCSCCRPWRSVELRWSSLPGSSTAARRLFVVRCTPATAASSRSTCSSILPLSCPSPACSRLWRSDAAIAIASPAAASAGRAAATRSIASTAVAAAAMGGSGAGWGPGWIPERQHQSRWYSTLAAVEIVGAT